MSIFAQYFANADTTDVDTDVTDISVADETTTDETTTEDVTVDATDDAGDAAEVTDETATAEDPEVDAFAEQRARLNQEHGLSQDGEGLPEGEYGEEVTPEKDGNDVTTDADDSEVVFTDEEEDAADDAELDAIDADDAEIAELDQKMQQMAGAGLALETYGVNPSALGVMQAVGLLDGTALATLGLESISFSSAKDAESQMAIEALGEKIKETAGRYAAKVVDFFKSVGGKIASVASKVWEKVSGFAKDTAAWEWERTKATAAFVKAHPFQTIAIVAGAIAAVGAIGALATSSAPALVAARAAPSAALGKIVAMVNKGFSKFPTAKITAAMSAAGDKIVLTATKVATTAKSASMASLGWTKQAFTAIMGQLTRAWGAFYKHLVTFGTTVVRVGGQALKSGGRAAVNALWSMTSTITKLVRMVVIGGLRLVLSTFASLKSVFTKGAAAATKAGGVLKGRPPVAGLLA